MFITKLKSLMKERKVTNKQLSLDIGIGINQVKYWEKNGNIPNGDVLKKIAEYFGVTVSDLIEEKKPTPKGELLEDVIIYHRDGQTVKREFTKEQMDMLVKMIEALPEKPKDI